ncbi:hypothetical protein SAMD00019534_072910 [Acytostelium subglobosum LB1]|uniref:hypothetical protein n=1 Tax=Acytostelium subglobosum LB1 TaxID=1410327 RepID=UPI000644E50F|nr:hypothetical protein SAMD00019534_072910 [Acytostelium subglobosum LB1]GAM24116.1 hypothetical protein SAMD00019534_072910 [Acytostelium subglobosum LB1]|eukprot:XP_012753152.1 hypothetical protein SAMD00019534_072910 [Acytostelium subglobosum LB1]
MTEPTTNGKVILKTTLGDIEIELWAKEAPKAVRNFVQLCLERYYDGCIFHRVVKNFIAQTGDPTGTGEGGQSCYDGGQPFKDEFHTRLRFSRRGLVGMASAEPDNNQSQFFITLDAAESLTRRHTLFGRVAGDTVFNALKMNEIELDESDRPLFPPKIISTEVMHNPFDDIVPRQKKQDKQVKEVKKKAAPKNLGLLSFGDDEEQDEEERVEKKQTTAKTTSKASNGNANTTTSTTSTSTTTTTTMKKAPTTMSKQNRESENESADSSVSAKSFDERMRESIMKKSASLKRDRDDDDDNKDKDKDKDTSESTTVVPATTVVAAAAKPPKKKKVVGSLQFKQTSKKAAGDGDGAPLAPPRVIKRRQDSEILEKLSQFKKKLVQEPTSSGSKVDADDDWMTHRLQFNDKSAGQEHYM